MSKGSELLMNYFEFIVTFLISMGGAAFIAGLFKLWLDHRTHKNRIKEMMAEKMIEYAEKYYLPLSTEMEGLRWSLAQKEVGTELVQLQYYFLHLARYFSRRSDMQNTFAGYILQDVNLERALYWLECKIYDDVTGRWGFLSHFELATT